MKSIIEILFVSIFLIKVLECSEKIDKNDKDNREIPNIRFKSLVSMENSMKTENKHLLKFRSRTKANSKGRFDNVNSIDTSNKDFNYFVDDNNSEVLSYLMKKENDISEIGSLGNWGNAPKLSEIFSGIKSLNSNTNKDDVWSKDLHCDCIKLKNITESECKCDKETPTQEKPPSKIVCDNNDSKPCNKTKEIPKSPKPCENCTSCNKTESNNTVENNVSKSMPINITLNIIKNSTNPSLEIPKLNKSFNQTINVNISTFNKPFELSYEKLFNMTKNALKGLLQRMPLNITVNLNKNIRGQSMNINPPQIQSIKPRPCMCPKIKFPECKAVCPELVIPKNNDTDKILDKLKNIEDNINDLKNKYDNLPNDMEPPSAPSLEEPDDDEEEEIEEEVETPNNDKLKKLLMNGILDSEKSKNTLMKYLLMRKKQNKKTEEKVEVKKPKEEEKSYMTYHRPQSTANRVISTYSVINGLYYTPVKPNVVIAKQVPCPSCAVRKGINMKNAITPIIIGE